MSVGTFNGIGFCEYQSLHLEHPSHTEKTNEQVLEMSVMNLSTLKGPFGKVHAVRKLLEAQ